MKCTAFWKINAATNCYEGSLHLELFSPSHDQSPQCESLSQSFLLPGISNLDYGLLRSLALDGGDMVFGLTNRVLLIMLPKTL
jgi:hypothetical protein